MKYLIYYMSVLCFILSVNIVQASSPENDSLTLAVICDVNYGTNGWNLNQPLSIRDRIILNENADAIELYGRALDTIPPRINLTDLDLSGNSPTKSPAEIWTLNNLIRFYLSGNILPGIIGPKGPTEIIVIDPVGTGEGQVTY